MLPNFIIVGAAKSGTTSLYHYLSEHPDVYMSEPKEVNYFSQEEITKQKLFYRDLRVSSLSEYKKLFEGTESVKAIGEGSVSYLFYPETPKKIYDLLPNVKIIILLRNPIERGFSHYLMDYRLGLVDLSYDEIVRKESKHALLNLYFQQYVELGLYYEQVKRYQDLFGKEQVKIYLMDDLKKDTRAVIDDLYSFLGIDKSLKPDLERKHNTFIAPRGYVIRKLYSSHFLRRTTALLIPDRFKKMVMKLLFNKGSKPNIELGLKKELQNVYTPDIKKLEKLIERDLSEWY